MSLMKLLDQACPDCGCIAIFIDRENGEIVCMACETVLEDVFIPLSDVPCARAGVILFTEKI